MSNRIHYSSKKEFVLGLLKPKDESLLVCGAGGSRTLVQTRKPYAFYMLIPAFGFRVAAEPGPSTDTLSP